MTHKSRIEREDLVTFVNACFACTKQQEFYSGVEGQALSIDFLHRYILGNYRRLYARCLAAGINHFNQTLVIENLLAKGAPKKVEDRTEEGELIRTALQKLPPPRVFRLFEQLARRRVNNRRTRAVMKSYLASRRDLPFTAMKYRRRVRATVRHAHIQTDTETHQFLFTLPRVKKFETPWYEKFRAARYAASGLSELPHSVAVGLAARHKIESSRLLQLSAEQLTSQEKLRLQTSASRAGVKLDFDLARAPLTRLALFVLSLSPQERLERRDELDSALAQAAGRTLRRAPLRLGRVTAVLDRSYSSSGSFEKRRRPLGVALAARYLLEQASESFHEVWTGPETPDPIMVWPRGQSNLSDAIITALRTQPEHIFIVSDGFENDPPNGAAELIRVFRRDLDPRGKLSFVHLNPVFDAEHFEPRAIGPALPTVGLRDAEDIPTVLGFARFADGMAPLSELESYLDRRVQDFVETQS